MKASAEQQASLLDLQKHDTALLQLSHRRNTLPQIAEVAELEGKVASLNLRLVAIKTEISDTSLAATKAENDVEQVVARAQRDQQRLDSGAVSNPKDLEALQHEIESLGKRQAELEDVELEIMEQLESARAVQAEIETELTDVQAQLLATTTIRDEEFAQIDALIAQETASRNEIASLVASDLLALYDKIRLDLGGVGAALLHRGACQGCHISMDATEIDRIRHLAIDEVIRCEECRRILIRTAESGL
ncbi:MAG: hypothetical protein KGQ38_05340 [Actinomycetales bacterium]|nr:hypothetical protein [Actinomycetales bacterium]